VSFNFMFEFINRAASMNEPVTVNGLDEADALRPLEASTFRTVRGMQDGLTSASAKEILVGAFSESLRQLGVLPVRSADEIPATA